MTARFTSAPSLDDFAEIARRAFETIPEALRAYAEGVVIRVAEFPDEDTEAEMGLDSPFDLLGLYHGTPIGEKSAGGTPQDVDMISLYRRPMLDYWCETGEDLTHLVRHVLIHEIGHHFGFSDEAMEQLELDAAAEEGG